MSRPALVLVAAALAGTLGAALAPRSDPRAVAQPAASLPPAIRPAFTPGPARGLGSLRDLAHWAVIRRGVTARAGPSRRAAPVAALARRTPEGTPGNVAVLGHRADGAGRVWVHVRLPVLPNGTTGWVPRTALGAYATVDTRLDVDLERLSATLYRAGRPVLTAPIGVGAPGWETPRGTFYVRNRLTRYSSPAYGPVAFGTSARSPHATDWPAGGFIGIHGTDRPDLIPGRVSHGCIRLRDADILRLARRMPVGTPVRIR